ncbi:MAG: IS1 family transposase, partial [Cyanobacteria bacterium SID2]|nr:IS1 family transposase [Cyanobacteria bacterium SID2]
MDRWLLEKISLAGIARVTNVSRDLLQKYVNQKNRQTPRQLKTKPKKKGKLTLECDKIWSFVKNKNNKIWIGLALDRDTREVVGFAVGDRSRKMARELWNSLAPVYRQCAV